MRHSLRVCAAALVAAGLSACPPPNTECIDGTEETCDAGAPPPDFCNSQEEADQDSANCHLTVTTGGAEPSLKEGVYLSRLEDGGVDRDWYVAQLPTLTPRSLLHINGGYQVPLTAVNFQINVLKQGASGVTSIATAVDRRAGGAAPKPVDIILPFSESNAKLYLLVSDEGGAQVRVDNRNTYSLYVEVEENPDTNEPNDETATTVTLAPGNGGQEGMTSGYLATTNDVDLYEFTVGGTGRQIIYLHMTGPTEHPTNPPPPYIFSYTLFDPAGTPVAEGRMDNATLPIDLATARLAAMPGAYKLKVQGYREPNSMTPIRGDLRVQYQVAVRVLPDLDTQEPNDTAATARTLSLSPNGTTSVTGKLSYVGDDEWFSVSLPSRATPSTLRYRVTTATSGGRFEPLTNTPNRQFDLVQPITTGATPQDRETACKNDRSVCPRGSDGDVNFLDTFCEDNSPPQCVHSHREEEIPRIANIRNLVGAVPVAVGRANEYLIGFKDQGLRDSKYADDRDFTITLEWRDDADEAGRTGGPEVLTVSGTPVVAQGEITFGYGKYLDEDRYFNSSDGLRGLADYDAVDTDKDLFQFNVAATVDQSWQVSWELMHTNDGGTRPPADLGVELVFCTALGSAVDGGICTGQSTRVFAYNPAELTPWYLPQSQSNGRQLFRREVGPSSTTVTAESVGCSCLSAPRLAAGAYFINVGAVDRTSNDPLRYRITQSIAAYPANFTTPDGGGGTCPVADGGCGFAR